MQLDHFFKFLLVGGTSFIINSIALIVGVRAGLLPSISGALGAEISIIFNFIANNFFTFSDRPITSWSQVPEKFITFNILSCGSLLIQFTFLKVGELIFGVKTFKQPVLQVVHFDKWPVMGPIVELFLKIKPLRIFLEKKLTLYFVFFMMGVGVGLIVNFTIYSLVIWK